MRHHRQRTLGGGSIAEREHVAQPLCVRQALQLHQLVVMGAGGRGQHRHAVRGTQLGQERGVGRRHADVRPWQRAIGCPRAQSDVPASGLDGEDEVAHEGGAGLQQDGVARLRRVQSCLHVAPGGDGPCPRRSVSNGPRQQQGTR